MLEHLRANLFVDIQALKDELGVSIATIRRDLTELESRGLLKRTHGGAISVNQVTRDSANAERALSNAAEKARIADAAAAMVVSGDAVLIDSGTTALEVARRLAGNDTLTFVTNGADVVAVLAAGGARRIHVVGGEYIDVNHSFAGPLAADMVRKFNVDKAFLSVSSVDVRRSLICTQKPEFACVQQAMIEVAQSVIVVADHSKFDRTSLAVIAPLERVDYVVTDNAARGLVAGLQDKTKKKFVFA
ncbi:transcriptional repressor AccR [Alsobacter metallidurans]|uniref:Transcriptional repressor AccR n=1 Tax=Alsobacter metallidurans TaxID=340221 RepID=A0A917ICU4_9HYPH|nr:transcriptional repressor AccR [Alsobacter metallidurans]